jgi:DNA-directed RNA polymerase specialized sigma24 family protein
MREDAGRASVGILGAWRGRTLVCIEPAGSKISPPRKKRDQIGSGMAILSEMAAPESKTPHGSIRGPADAEQAYRQFRAVMLAVVGRLAQRGYAVAPPDGLDLVHSFFVEEWTPLMERYDPTRGEVRPYLLTAFVRFARKRIVRDTKLRGVLCPVDDLLRIAGSTAGEQNPGRGLDALAVSRAASQLASQDRSVLAARFGSGLSERSGARALAMTRHAFREHSLEAIGRLAAALGERGCIPASDWKLAIALWRHERSMGDASRSLGMTEAQAKRSYSRILDALSAGLRGLPQESRQELTMRVDMCSLWKRLVRNPPDRKAVVQARNHSDDLLDHLSECEDCASTRIDDADM